MVALQAFRDERDAFNDAVLKNDVDRFVGQVIVRVFVHGWCLVSRFGLGSGAATGN